MTNVVLKVPIEREEMVQSLWKLSHAVYSTGRSIDGVGFDKASIIIVGQLLNNSLVPLAIIPEREATDVTVIQFLQAAPVPKLSEFLKAAHLTMCSMLGIIPWNPYYSVIVAASETWRVPGLEVPNTESGGNLASEPSSFGKSLVWFSAVAHSKPGWEGAHLR
jgi:hypothetical protein